MPAAMDSPKSPFQLSENAPGAPKSASCYGVQALGVAIPAARGLLLIVFFTVTCHKLFVATACLYVYNYFSLSSMFPVLVHCHTYTI